MDDENYRAAESRLWRSLGALPIDRRLDLERLGVSVRVQEVGQGRPVLFVHGATSGGTSWAPLAARLDGVRCLILDRPGCGLSEPLAGPADETVAEALIPDVLDALSLDAAPVITTSYGAYFTFRAAAAEPDRIERILAFSWCVGAPLASVPFVLRLSALPGAAALATRMPVGRRSARMMLGQVGLKGAIRSGRFDDLMLDWFVSLLDDTDTLTNEIRSSPPVVTALAGANRALVLTPAERARIPMPVWFLWGGDDPNGGAEVAEPFAAGFPDATLELLPGAGHAPWVDDPDHAAAVTNRFLNPTT